MPLIVTKDRTKALAKALKELYRKEVLVGIPADAPPRKPDGDDPSPINNATLGYILEHGSPAANIPARPHLKQGIRDAKEDIAKTYKRGVQALIDGKASSADEVHRAVGQLAANAVKRRITDGPFTPLAPRTIAERKRRGRTSQKPLIDTGQYRNSVTFVISPRRARPK